MNKHGSGWIWLPTRMAIYARDDFRCLACNRRLWRKAGLSLDHVTPGGPNTPGNLVTLCISCNSEKADRRLADWRPDLVPRVRAALRTPIDRARGRALAEKVSPGFHVKHSARRKAYRARIAAGWTSDDFDPGSYENS